MQGISSLGPSASNTPALPWRRANVRHTSNELYVDVVETLSVTIAPSGRPLAAFANGTIAFTSKISGVPDLLLTLSSPSGKQNLESVIELPVFHPCVRLARWRERPGELSFVPPDGRFVLAGYEVDLLPFTSGKVSNSSANLKLPIQIEVKTSLGTVGADFEVRAYLSKIAGSTASSTLSGSSIRPGGRLGGSSGGNASPGLEDLIITVPIPPDVRTLSDIRASRGDTTYNPGDATLEWHILAKDASVGAATLRCTVVGTNLDDDDMEGNGFTFDGTKGYDYNENEPASAYQNETNTPSVTDAKEGDQRDEKRIQKNKILMPSSARVSFAVKGWLASGIKVESLTIDTRKSRGLGEGVKPYKGVKYLCISRGGVEIRC
jgi:AP-3 complex subunit mu